MKNRKSILILAYVAPYNRQGYDLFEILRKDGYSVTLFQKDGDTDAARGVFGISCPNPHGPLHKFQTIWNLLKFGLRTICVPKEIVICVGKPILLLGGFYSILFGSRLIWYSLEYSQLGLVDRFIYRHCVRAYIDVEENRRNAIFIQYGKKTSTTICHNMPHLHASSIRGGKLRQYLYDHHGITKNVNLIMYAGSYQRYACLDKIVKASTFFSESCILVLMAFGLPDKLEETPNCIVVPPIKGEEFYEWLTDADCALLPYESSIDFNVINCSPQKLFDCYLAGVPFVASDRPIVRQTLDYLPQAGMLCDFTDEIKIANSVNFIIGRKPFVAKKMQHLHRERFNYGRVAENILEIVSHIL